MSVKLNDEHLKHILQDEDYKSISPQVVLAHEQLHTKTGKGNTFLGWLNLPSQTTQESLEQITATAKHIRENTDVFIVIGIGGSYLGARAAIEAIMSKFYNNLPNNSPQIFFAGNNMDTSYLRDILCICDGKRVSLLVVSKSGATTEPALAFRILKEWLEDKVGKKEARERIYVITDKKEGTLRKLVEKEGYTSFIIPDDVGGRYSGLTPVGLLPIAVAGLDIFKLIDGAKVAEGDLAVCNESNPCYKYAATRYLLYKKGFQIELFAGYRSSFAFFGEWLKQLFGESDGKEEKGLFPAYSTYTTDLHSLGQFVQEGPPILFETILDVLYNGDDIEIEKAEEDFDNLNYLAGKSLQKINNIAMEATMIAHAERGVPNILLTLPGTDEASFGYAVYFFEKACAMSGYLLDVNPFTQPGVEAYKQKMFSLLGKPGYEGR